MVSRSIPMFLILCVAGFAGAPAPLASARQAEKPAAASSTGARAALDAAAKIKRQSFKKTGEEKRAILLECVAAYEAVLRDHKDDEAACAEAAFRIGELRRSLNDDGGASSAFEKAASYGKVAPRFAARALNEIGHLLRRANQTDEALAAYGRVLTEHAGEEGEGVKALTWIGKIQAKTGHAEDARKTWLSIGDRFRNQPVAAIRAADLAALSALDAGLDAEARRILDETRARYAEGPQWTPEVDEALGRMRVAKRLGQGGDDDGEG